MQKLVRDPGNRRTIGAELGTKQQRTNKYNHEGTINISFKLRMEEDFKQEKHAFFQVTWNLEKCSREKSVPIPVTCNF